MTQEDYSPGPLKSTQLLKIYIDSTWGSRASTWAVYGYIMTQEDYSPVPLKSTQLPKIYIDSTWGSRALHGQSTYHVNRPYRDINVGE